MKKILLVVCTLLLLLPTLVFAEGDEISSWAEETIEKVKGENLLDPSFFSGYGQAITRAEFAYLGVKLYEQYTGQTAEVGDATFSDTEDEWALKAKNVGIVGGYDDGSFKPANPIKREELAKLFHNIFKAANVEYIQYTGEAFADDDAISSWAKESVYIAKANKIISGVGSNTFEPQGQATKEQSLVMFNKGQYSDTLGSAIEKVEVVLEEPIVSKNDKTNFLTDFWNDTQWYYYNNPTDNEKFYRVNKVSQKEEKVFEHLVNKAFVYNGKLYTIVKNELSVSNLDGSGKTLVKQFDAFYGKAYFASNNLVMLQNSQLYIYHLDDGRSNKLTTSSRYIYDFTRNSNSIYYCDYQEVLYTMDLTSLKENKLSEGCDAYNMRYDAGKIYYASSRNGRLGSVYAFDLSKNSEALIFNLENDRMYGQGLKYYEVHDSTIIYTEKAYMSSRSYIFSYNMLTKEHKDFRGNLSSYYLRKSNDELLVLESDKVEDYLEIIPGIGYGKPLMIAGMKVKHVLESDNDNIYFISSDEETVVYKYNPTSKALTKIIEHWRLDGELPLYVANDRYVVTQYYSNYEFLFIRLDNQAGPFDYEFVEFDGGAHPQVANGLIYSCNINPERGMKPFGIYSYDPVSDEKKTLVDKNQSILDYHVASDKIIYSTWEEKNFIYDLAKGQSEEVFEGVGSGYYYSNGQDVFFIDYDKVYGIDFSNKSLNLLSELDASGAGSIGANKDYLFLRYNYRLYKLLLSNNTVSQLGSQIEDGYRFINGKVYVSTINKLFYDMKTNSFLESKEK